MNQTSAIAQAHQFSGNPHSLAAFDFAFNGALDPAQVHEIATAAFIGRGENLLLVGGAGTGKTVIAMEVRKQASALGLSSEYLVSGYSFAEDQLVARGPGFLGCTGNQHGLREDLLNCDLLVVDEADRWMQFSQTAFLVLIGRRIELGKSNVLVASTGGWKSLFRRDGTTARRQSMMPFFAPEFVLGYDPAFLLGDKVEQSEWGMMMVRERYMPLAEVLAILGIDFSLPAVEAEDSVQSALPDSRLSRRVPKPFVKEPVWHTLYTGENSYREVLRRRA